MNPRTKNSARRVATHLVVFAAFVLAAIIMTWPLARNLSRAVDSPADPLINSWILDWDWHALTTGASLFDANIFYPAKDTFAFSENLLGIFAMFVPLFIAGVSPLLIHNIALLVGFAFSGYGMWLLARHLSKSSTAALVSAVFYAFLPWRFVHLPHLQFVWGGWLPILLLATILLIESPTWRRTALFSAASAANGLCNLHYFVFGSVAVVIVAGVALMTNESARRREFWIRFLAGLFVAGLLLMPVLSRYQWARTHYGMRGDMEETAHYSARPGDWFVAGPRSETYGFLKQPEVDPERSLFTGFAALIIATVALSRRRIPRFVLLLSLTLIVVGVLASFGPAPAPYRFLFEYLSPIAGIRAAARWGVVAYLGVAILLPFAVPDSRWKPFAAVAMIAAILFDGRATLRYYLIDPAPPPVYQWLSAQSLEGGVVELPIGGLPEYRYVYRAAVHHQPLVNGISGFTPPAHRDLLASWDRLDQDFLDRLTRMRASVILVHADDLYWKAPAVHAWLRSEMNRGRLEFLARFDEGLRGCYAFAITPGGRASSLRQVAPPAGSPFTAAETLGRFIDGEWTYNSSPFGLLGSPVWGDHVRGDLHLDGWALAPSGVREVRLHFQNDAVRVLAKRFANPSINRPFPWYPHDPEAGFNLVLKRPAAVRYETDLEVEIIANDGTSRRLPPVFFTWAE